MPTVPSSGKCSELGCTNPRAFRSSYCEQHQPQRDKYKRPIPKDRCSHDGMYNTPFWISLRRSHLSANPLCAGCLADGIVTSAKHLDHVFPWTLLGKEAFTRNLFQSLCHSCHSSKTALEKKGIFRRYGHPTVDYSLNDYSFILPPSNRIESD